MARNKPKAAASTPPPLTPSVTSRYKRDLRQCRKRGLDLAKLKAVIEALCQHRHLADRHKDHPLRGDWKECRECHIEPDWLLIYRTVGHELQLIRTGTHADLFE